MVRSTKGKHSDYFEAILQLRNILEEVVSFVENDINKSNVPVAKKKKVKNGWDYYLADNDFTRALGKRLQQKFGGENTVTASLFGQKEGKEIYRLTVLFRGIPFSKEDLVEYQGEEYKVKILGKDMLLQDVKTGKKVHVKYKDMDQIKKTNKNEVDSFE